MKAIVAGILSGGLMKILTGSLADALITALLTGMAAYIGQQSIKWVHIKLKKKK